MVVTADFYDQRYVTDLVALLDLLATEPVSGAITLAESTRTRLGNELARRVAYYHMVAFIAYVEDEAVGCAVVQEGFSTFTYRPQLNLHDLVVVPAWRGRQVGEQLLMRVEECARERGCCAISLEVVAANKVAVALYTRHGYADAHTGMNVGKTWYWSKMLA